MAVSSSWSIRRFVDQLGSEELVPGGGSAAALAGALGVALGSMVSRILLTRSGIAPSVRRRIQRKAKTFERLSRRLEALIKEDAEAYQAYVKAKRTGRNLVRARARAIDSPREICRLSLRALKLMDGLSGWAGPSLSSDLKAGKALLTGALQAARITFQVNL